MIEDRIVYMNGAFVAWKDARVHIMSHSLARASAIFEVISLHSTPQGPVIFRLKDHIKRLFKSAKLINMELPLSRKAFYDKVSETVKRNKIEHGIIKIVAYFPQIAFDILPPQWGADVSIFVADPSKDSPNTNFAVKPMESACISKWRKPDPQTVPVEAKVSANYLNGMIAKMEANQNGFEHAIMLDTQGFIAECGTDSVFLVKDDCLMTATLGTILDSITRRSILEAAAFIGIETYQGRLKPELLFKADEIFLSCAPFKVQPINKIEERKIEITPGPLTGKLSALLDRITEGREDHFKDWLYPVK
ncbi:aminotransferase class IV [Desulfococcaceae bacterium HSG9]|nr:aminotransferase class IV [Desulfococcaceae bacterium HSG9]